MELNNKSKIYNFNSITNMKSTILTIFKLPLFCLLLLSLSYKTMASLNQTLDINPNCNLVINEINPDVANKLEKNEFIELKLVCPNNGIEISSLKHFKIIIIDHKINGQPIIHTIVNLNNYFINENNFFTIGGIEVEEANLKIPSDDIMYRSYFDSKQLSNFIPNCNELPCGLALIYDESDLPLLKLSMDFHYLSIDSDLKTTIKSALKDLVIYGRRSKSHRCDIYEFLKPEYININYILRDFDAAFGTDLSINRCSVSTLPYVPESFKLGNPTPSQDNDCSMISFVMEKNLFDLTPPLISIVENKIVDICESGINPNIYESIRTQNVVNFVENQSKRQRLESCSTLLQDRNANIDRSDVLIANTRALQMGFDSFNEWDSIKYFDPNWINFMQTKLKTLMPVQTILSSDEIKSWLIFRPNQDIPNKSRYLCRICSEYFDLMLMTRRARSELANIDGVEVSLDKKKNADIIRKHYSSTGHQAVTRELIRIDNQKLDVLFNEMQRKSEISNQAYAATARMFRTVYTEIRANVPFSNHYLIVELQKTHGVEIGYLFANRWGATNIAKCISDEMHKRLINHLKNENNPISVLVDTSEDQLKNHYLSVMIQAIENKRPIVYFYKLILLSSTETGFGLFQSFYNQIVDDNLVNYFKKNLIGFVSDGASVMTSEKVGFVAHIKKTFGANIVGIKCMAHRLQLVAAHAMKAFPYFTEFEALINELHSFYFGHSHKRPIKLRELAQELDLVMYKLDYIFQVRWLASELKAITKVQKMWLLLINDLKKISTDMSERLPTRTKAKSILKKLTDKNFVILLHFIIDVLDLLNVCSLEFQKTAGMLIGKSYLINKMEAGIIKLKYNFGSSVVELMSTIKCPYPASVHRPCSLENYDENTISWQDIELYSSEAPNLTSIREQFLDLLLQEIKTMFPDLNVKNFDIFLPNNIPRISSEFAVYGKNELQELLKYFKWDFTFDLLHNDWINLLNSMFSNHDVWCKVQDLSPNLFWSEFLKLQIWTPRTLKIIYTALVLPVGSADVERSFSFLNMIKSRRRISLSPSNLDILIRIKMNGPIEISKFPAMEYAKVWIENGNSPVDDKSHVYEKKETTQDSKPDFTYLDRSSLF